ncbi:reverse transcriptase domain-containing protein [Tanacetum coccineum]
MGDCASGHVKVDNLGGLLIFLLHKESITRLGSGTGGSDEINNQSCLKSINWKKLEGREFKPSFVPQVAENLLQEMEDQDMTMEEYVQYETEKALRNDKVYYWETATYDKIWYDEDVHYLRLFETEFPTIRYNDALHLNQFLSSLMKPTVISAYDES